MKNAIILHGLPSKEEYYSPRAPSLSNAHWLPWLQAQLLKADVAAATPEVPNSFDLDWKVWSHEFERFDIAPETILVGHSAGGGFLIKYLSIHPHLKVGKVVLVAPWLDPEGRTKGFFDDFSIDPDFVGRTSGTTVFSSDDDQDSVQRTVTDLRSSVKKLSIKEFHNYGHFCYRDMRTVEFPELAAEALS